MSEPVEKKSRKEKEGYRLNARHTLITWSGVRQQMDAYKENDNYPYRGECLPTKEEIRDALIETIGFTNVRNWAVAEEKHEDGSIHFHAAVQFREKMDIRNADTKFRLLGCVKPSFSQKKGRFAGAMEYCEKTYDFIRSPVRFSRRGFCKQKRDHDAFEAFLVDRRNSDDPFPFTLPNGEVQDEPGPADKRCNWLIVAPPDTGKTRWAMDTFAGKSVFFPNLGDTPFDHYRGQRVIIYDDHFPTREHLIRLSNFHRVPVLVPGRTRYECRRLPIGRRLCIILLHNQRPGYALESFYRDDGTFQDNQWFHARFRTVECESFSFGMECSE